MNTKTVELTFVKSTKGTHVYGSDLEDAAAPSLTPGEQQGDERWEGTGRFLLPDFCKLTGFLNDMSSSNGSPLAI